MTRLTTEVVVLGAGPAGCVFARRMAELGFEVCLIERARFPRRHLGESLTPGVLPMLASIGASGVVATAGCSRVREVHTNWDGMEAVRRFPAARGLLVERGAFDAALLAHARAAGVRVFQPGHVRERVGTETGFRMRVEAAGESIELHAGFFADARGRSAPRGAGRKAMGPRTIAIYGYFGATGVALAPRIEAGEAQWYWGVPLPDGSYNTLVFVDGERFRSEPGGTLDDRLRSLLARSALMTGLGNATLLGPARAADATPYLSDDCVSAREIRLGDAALALDPLSSSGVQKAIQTALSGAIVVNTLLRRPDAREAALQFYRTSLNDAAERHRSWASSHYATAAPGRTDRFWTERAAGAAQAQATMPMAVTPISSATDIPNDVPLRLSPDCRWEELPCLGSRYVELKTALRHPELEGPVAYLGGEELAPLLRGLAPGLTKLQIAAAWSRSLASDRALKLAAWLARRGVLERAQP
jgi:flavin-dependent dehydrogenase